MKGRGNITTRDGLISDDTLSELNVVRVSQYDFENLDSGSSNLNQNPPILFKPMLLDELQNHPVDTSTVEDASPFMEYGQTLNGRLRNTEARTLGICDNLEDWITGDFRPTTWKHGDLLDIQGLRRIWSVLLRPLSEMQI